MTPQELFDTLIKELSASGSLPINASTEADPQPNVTLREAVGRIFWKEAASVDLKGRPRPPDQADDQLGHVLSMRAEGLQTQALLAALCEAAGIDVANILTQVKGSL